MDNNELQRLTENISLQHFNKPFLHEALFNNRLSATGGRYILQSHNIEISTKQYEAFGEAAITEIIKHELVHYHLHIEGKGYRHRDRDFKALAKAVGTPRFCSPLPNRTYKYRYICKRCDTVYPRQRRMSTYRYRCKCGGRLKEELTQQQ